MLAFSFPFCKDFGSKQVTWISKGSGTHTSSHNVPVDIARVFTKIASFPDVMQLSMTEAI